MCDHITPYTCLLGDDQRGNEFTFFEDEEVAEHPNTKVKQKRKCGVEFQREVTA